MTDSPTQLARSYNPFAKREAHGSNTVLAYRILTPLSWILVLVIAIFYSARTPDDVSNGLPLWQQIGAHPTPFTQNRVITAIYWIVLLISQLGYISHLFSKDAAVVTAAINVASYYILNNLFVVAFVLLWVRSFFAGAEVIVAANFLSQAALHSNHRGLPTLVHFSAIAGPYAWTFTELFWNGAVAVAGNGLAARIVANIFIWSFLLVGEYHIFTLKDTVFGFSLSILTLSLAVEQFLIKIVALQWIFGFVIFGVLFAGSAWVSTGRYYGRDLFFRSEAPAESSDPERQPLLDE
ncbi:hypothetical protein FQN54_002392 [Arachnomyces sp. PD_36]|nr:hypothetical protein FQN54_002392 [Arachnomyces sp. PD_36]